MSFWRRWFKNDEAGGEGDAPPAPGAAPGGPCSHGAIQLRADTAEFEWFIARGELEEGRDLAHGARHLADLLTYDPANPTWRELLDRYVAAAKPRLSELFPTDDKRYFAFEAVRAYDWQKAGRLDDALDLLTQVVRAKPDARYLEAWALEWLEPEGVLEALPADVALPMFMLTLTRFGEARYATRPNLRAIRRWAALSERWYAAQPSSPRPEDAMLRAGLLRKAGALAEAASIAESALDRAPSWYTATALGLIHRERGEPRRAEASFEHALRLDPTDVSARLEAGDSFFLVGDWQNALRWYEDALSKEPSAWAEASALYCRHKLGVGEGAMARLEELAAGGNERADELLYDEGGGDTHRPFDATANVLRQVRENLAPRPDQPHTGSMKLSLSALEAPSNSLAFRLEMAARDADAVVLKTVIERVQTPDPRVPLESLAYTLWAYDGTEPRPALPRPPEDVLARIAEVASTPGRSDRANASRVAEELGAGRVEEILATMVHPPPLPRGGDALVWVPRVQRVCAAILGELKPGWAGSRRRAALYAVLLGPRDWTTIAAILELGFLGRRERAHGPDIGEAFGKLAKAVTPEADCPWEVPLYQAWSSLPYLFPSEREKLEAHLRALEERKGEKVS